MKISKKVGRNIMARELILNLNKKTSSFAISKIDRKKLYGFKKRIYLILESSNLVSLADKIKANIQVRKNNLIRKK